MIVDIDTIGNGLEDTGSGEIRIKCNDTRLIADGKGLRLADSLLGRNFVINGDFGLWQRGTAFTSLGHTNYGPDRWRWIKIGAGNVDFNRATDTPDGSSEYSMEIDVTAADASLAAGDNYSVHQFMEAENVRNLGFGSANAKMLTVSFWVKSPKSGTHSLSLKNAASDQNHIAEYTVNIADTWEYKAVSIPGDTSGTWATTGIGLSVVWCLAAGSSSQGAVNTWQAGDLYCSANQVNCLDAIGNKFRLSRVQVETGPAATPFEHRTHGQELSLCQRYYCKTFPQGSTPAQNSGTVGALQTTAASNGNFTFDWSFPVTMRATPGSIVTYNPSAANASARNLTDTTDTAPSTGASDRGVVLKPGTITALDADDTMAVHVTASAEL